VDHATLDAELPVANKGNVEGDIDKDEMVLEESGAMDSSGDQVDEAYPAPAEDAEVAEAAPTVDEEQKETDGAIVEDAPTVDESQESPIFMQLRTMALDRIMTAAGTKKETAASVMYGTAGNGRAPHTAGSIAMGEEPKQWLTGAEAASHASAASMERAGDDDKDGKGEQSK